MTLTNQDLADEFRRVVAADPQRHGAVVVRGLLTIAADRLAPNQEIPMEPLCPICEKVFTEGQEVVVPEYFDAGLAFAGHGQKYHKTCFQALYVDWKQGGEPPEPPRDYAADDAELLELERRKVAALELIAERLPITMEMAGTLNVGPGATGIHLSQGTAEYAMGRDDRDPTIEALVATHLLGFTQTVDPESEEPVNGFTCSACGAFMELPEGGIFGDDLAGLELFHQDDVRVTMAR